MIETQVTFDDREELKRLFRLEEGIDAPPEFQSVVWDLVDALEYVREEDGATLQFVQDQIGASSKQYVRSLLLILQEYDFVTNDGKVWRPSDA